MSLPIVVAAMRSQVISKCHSFAVLSFVLMVRKP